MDAAGVIAHYVMDGDRPLTAETAGNTTLYLYGLGAIGEKTNAWSYSLPDGTNTPRQLSDDSGEITLSARYTPWGDTLDTYGTGKFTFGYLGGVLDASTGLLYVGNGQYYDPQTGRFLTRDANPNSTNPYVPWNPIGVIVGPLGLISLVASRKRGRANPYLLMFVMLVVLPVGIGIACSGDVPSGEVTAVVHPDGTATVTFSDGTTVTGTLPAPGGAPSTPLAIPCPTPEFPTPYDLSNLPAPNQVYGDPKPYLQAMASKYNIGLPSEFQWDYVHKDDFQSGCAPDNYGVTMSPVVQPQCSGLNPNTIYINSNSFTDLNEIQFASVMFHEARHAWLIHFVFNAPGDEKGARIREKLPDINLSHPFYGPYWGLLTEADAFNQQGVFLRQHGAPTTLPLVGDVFARSQSYLDTLKELTGETYIVPLPYGEPW